MFRVAGTSKWTSLVLTLAERCWKDHFDQHPLRNVEANFWNCPNRIARHRIFFYICPKAELEFVPNLISCGKSFSHLWLLKRDDMNILEHLLFYSRLKGFPRSREMQHVEDVIRQAGRGEKKVGSTFKRRSEEGAKYRHCTNREPISRFYGRANNVSWGLFAEFCKVAWILQVNEGSGTLSDLLVEGTRSCCQSHSLEEIDVLCTRVGEWPSLPSP